MPNDLSIYLCYFFRNTRDQNWIRQIGMSFDNVFFGMQMYGMYILAIPSHESIASKNLVSCSSNLYQTIEVNCGIRLK